MIGASHSRGASRHERRSGSPRQGDPRAPRRFRQRQRPIEPAARRFRRGLPAGVGRAHAPCVQRRGRQGGLVDDDRSRCRRRNRALRPHRRRADEGPTLERRSVRLARNRRQALRARRLRHERFRRGRAGHGPRVSGGEPEKADSRLAELRRGDDRSRLARRDRGLRRRSAASRPRHRGRTDDDGGRRRAQGNCDLRNARHRRRGAFCQAATRRQRDHQPLAKSSPRSAASAGSWKLPTVSTRGSIRPGRPFMSA